MESDIDSEAASSESKMSSGGELRSLGKKVDDKTGDDETSDVVILVGNDDAVIVVIVVVAEKASIFGILFESSIVATFAGDFPICTMVGPLVEAIVVVAAAAMLLMLTTLTGFVVDCIACITGNGCCGTVMELKRID